MSKKAAVALPGFVAGKAFSRGRVVKTMTDNIHFLTASQALTIHHKMLERYGGRPGVANPHGLASALAQPRASMFGQYLHNSLEQMAETYYFYLVKNSPFHCHNQKTAFLCARVFLALNKCHGPGSITSIPARACPAHGGGE